MKSVPVVDDPLPVPAFTVHRHWGPLRNRFCSEALLTGQGLDIDRIRSLVQEFGDSAIVAGSDELFAFTSMPTTPPAFFSGSANRARSPRSKSMT